MATTRSKLGAQYPTALIQAKDREFHEELKVLRSLPHNKQCAECQASPSTWASVSLGVFVCMRCAQVHRNLGAHLSKVKSCMGTYLWCPDEIEQMKRIGNRRAWLAYTGGAHVPPAKPSADADFETVDRFARDKYEHKRWLRPGGIEAVLAEADDKPDRARIVAPPVGAPSSARDTQAARQAARAKVQQLRRAACASARQAQPAQRSKAWDDFDEWPEERPSACPNVDTPQTLEAFFSTSVPGADHRSQEPASGADLLDLFTKSPAAARVGHQVF